MEAGDTISQLDDFEKRMKKIQENERLNEEHVTSEVPLTDDMSSPKDGSNSSVDSDDEQSRFSRESSDKPHSFAELKDFEDLEEGESGDEEQGSNSEASAKEEEKQVEIDTLQQRIEELQAQLQENEKKVLPTPLSSSQASSLGWHGTLPTPLDNKSTAIGFADEPRRAQTAATSAVRGDISRSPAAKSRLHNTNKYPTAQSSSDRPNTRQKTKTFTSNDVIIAKIRANLKRLEPGRNPVVLVSTGGYNPIHLQHLRMFYQARDYLISKKEYQVVGGIISPSHDHAVRHTLRSLPAQVIPGQHRLAMAEIAAEGSSWLSVDRWEVSRRSSLEYPSVLSHVEGMLEKVFGKVKAPAVMYLCGADHLVRCGPQTLQHFGCVCFSRPGFTEELEKVIGKRYQKLVHIVDDDEMVPNLIASLSSTKVRRRMISGKNVTTLVGDQVAKYVQHYDIGEKVAKRVPWSQEDADKVVYLAPAYQKMGDTFGRLTMRSPH